MATLRQPKKYIPIVSNEQDDAEQNTKSKAFLYAVGVIVLHMIIGYVMHYNEGFATWHARIVLLTALVLVVTKAPLHNIAAVLAYTAASEVLWRMHDARVLWEIGKYALLFFSAAALTRNPRLSIPVLGFIYIAFLAPSAIKTIDYYGTILRAKNALSFNLSGPLALFASAWLFSNIQLSKQQLGKLLIVTALPAVALVTKLFINLRTSTIVFHGDSNAAAAGGFGANQVSAALGVGMFCLILFFLIFDLSIRDQVLVLGLVAWMAGQTLMTFSRGGLVNGFGPPMFAIAYLLVSRHQKSIQRLGPIIGGGFLFMMFAFPALNAYTDGNLASRFSDVSTTGRSDIMSDNVITFLEHPVLGVGPGLSRFYNSHHTVAHTEFTRLIAEHGSFGLVSLLLLFLMGAINFFRNTDNPLAAALVIAVVCWSFVFMTHSAMRVAAPAFFFGMAFANFESLESDPKPQADSIDS